MRTRLTQACGLGAVLALIATASSSLINSSIIHPHYLADQLDKLERIRAELEGSADREAAADRLSERYEALIVPETEEYGFYPEQEDAEWSPADTDLFPVESSPIFYDPFDGAVDSIADMLELSDGTRWYADLAVDDPHYSMPSKLIEWGSQCVALLLALAWYAGATRRDLEDVRLSFDELLIDRRPSSPEPITAMSGILEQLESQLTELERKHEATVLEQQNLLANVAHEFRNPLARLQFANEMAASYGPGHEQRRLLEESDVAAHELDELVRGTLTYSRLRSKRTAMNLRPVSLLQVLRRLAHADDVTDLDAGFVVRAPERDPMLLADEDLLHRALVQLVVASHALARLTVTLQARLEPDGRLLVRIVNDGPALRAGTGEQAFEPFARLPSRLDSCGDTLGLPIARAILARHGARLSLEAHETGSCFRIRWTSRNDPQGTS